MIRGVEKLAIFHQSLSLPDHKSVVVNVINDTISVMHDRLGDLLSLHHDLGSFLLERFLALDKKIRAYGFESQTVSNLIVAYIHWMRESI